MASSENIIYRAGVDYESRPMVVLCACNLPDPSLVDYDTILRVVLAQLEQFVENDYTVVMFSGGALYRPGWRWLFKAYRSLNRRYKKNLKALYIVHPSTWPRLILGTMNAVISPKFGAKVHYIDNLSHLAKVVPLNQINIPAAVYQHNLKFEDTITLPDNQQDHAFRVFGAPLERLMGPSGEKGVPKFIQDCIRNLIENGLYVEGLFRRSPSSAMLKQVRAAYDRGNPVNLAEYDIHISAVLLKLFLRELPEPIFPVDLYGPLQQQKRDDQTRTVAEFIRTEVVTKVTHNNLILMMEVFRLLKLVADRQESNLMTAHNLAIVMTPNMVRHEDVMQEIALSSVSHRDKDSAVDGALTLGTVVKVMIEHYDEVF
ncbi:MAG: Rho GTPase activation protein [Linnemannia gamsii]|nr:MAG: Rho GTPase activation protein [Linnemannia gamsii]